MKRERPEEDEHRRVAGASGVGADGSDGLRIAHPPAKLVWEMDADGTEKFVAPITSTEVSWGVYKRLYRKHEWGRNAVQESEGQDEAALASSAIDPEVIEVARMVHAAWEEMDALRQFSEAVGPRIQTELLVQLPPPENEEWRRRYYRWSQRKAALASAAQRLVDGATKVLLTAEDDKRFGEEVLRLRSRWSMRIVGTELVAVASNDAAAGDSIVPLQRSPKGSVEAVILPPLRRILTINGASGFVPVASSVAIGVRDVDRMLLEAQRTAASAALFALISGSASRAASTCRAFASVRDEGGSIFADVVAREFDALQLAIGLGHATTNDDVTATEIMLRHCYVHMLQLLHTPQPLRPLGQHHPAVDALRRNLLSYALVWTGHERCRRHYNDEFHALCQQYPGLVMTWGGTDVRNFAEDDDLHIVSNAYFSYARLDNNDAPFLVMSLVNVGTIYMNSVSRRWTVLEAFAAVIATLRDTLLRVLVSKLSQEGFVCDMGQDFSAVVRHNKRVCRISPNLQYTVDDGEPLTSLSKVIVALV